MILLDTNVMSELMKLRPDTRVLAWLDEQIQSSVFTSAITRAEIELGIALYYLRENVATRSRKPRSPCSPTVFPLPSCPSMKRPLCITRPWLLTASKSVAPFQLKMRKSPQSLCVAI